ncbi:MAG: DNA mismatch repair protein MutS [Firmicutes bacterium]|nr:DNA mismatch repair protein MutS [Bacillota bacterium]
MMEQYREVKKEIPDCLLFFRLGDFYEMFFEDAITTSKELELTLTGRSCGENERAPMCGVPYHAAETYIQRLVQKGYKVAICEQMEDPKLAKGLVKREITRIVTPGTTMNENLPKDNNNYILSVNRTEDAIGLSACDITTGEFLVTEFAEEEKLLDEIAKFKPSEILINQDISEMMRVDLSAICERGGIYLDPYEAYHFGYSRCKERILRQFHVLHLEGLGLEGSELGVTAAGALLEYLTDTQKRQLEHINQVKLYSVQDYMLLDMSTRRNLELTETLRDKSYKGSLLWVLDHTQTAMGGRRLRKWLEQPLIHKERIDERLDAVEAVFLDPMLSAELKEMLGGIYDMERLMGRISYGSANARDLIALKESLKALPGLKLILKDLEGKAFRGIDERMDSLEDIFELLESAIEEEPPVTLREGGIIKTGYNEQVDRFRSAATDGKKWLAELESKEKEATGIKTLKVGYNRVFGYYIEVSKGQLSAVPDRFIRKQTLVNGERFITEELKEIEDTLLGAKEKGEALEYDLFTQIRSRVFDAMVRIQKSADAVADLDAIRSLADTAYRNGYVKPQILPPGGEIRIREGRHPVVEKMLPENSFIANDTFMNVKDQRMQIITGPNMAGKSTYMRQVAAIVLLAQIGSFVPADEAVISIADRIFTRVGASDDLARGQSTFMVEMSEVSNILRHASSNSLLILDEIGRGTSTFDGLAIAWAVVEYISDPKVIGAKTLFATHYHELTQLEGKIPGVRNYCVTIKENGDSVIFLHKILPGSGDQSYGIEVAKLAGLPDWVLKRAHSILSELLEGDVVKRAMNLEAVQSVEMDDVQTSLFSSASERQTREESQVSAQERSVIEMLKETDADRLTPLEAMQMIYDLKQKLEEGAL